MQKLKTIFPSIFAAMNYNDDVQVRWFQLERELMERFGKKPDVETILFLIGMQELGEVGKKFSKDDSLKVQGG